MKGNNMSTKPEEWRLLEKETRVIILEPAPTPDAFKEVVIRIPISTTEKQRLTVEFTNEVLL